MEIENPMVLPVRAPIGRPRNNAVYDLTDFWKEFDRENARLREEGKWNGVIHKCVPSQQRND